jgi:SagB-type dehydrogenase family enzyme
MTWHEYHEATRHSVEALKRSRHFLDWANMPEPFRHYEGTPLLDLPADPVLGEVPADGAAWLSQLLFHAAAVSASKVAPGSRDRYALRVNPSSGNLHPTEFHFRTRGLQDWPDGLYHYRPSSHMAEQRGRGDFGTGLAESSAPVVFVLTSIAWREAWKYRERAYRYCLHDIGHAWQSLAIAAGAMRCESFASGEFDDDSVAVTWRLHEDEWPMLVVELRGESIPLGGQPEQETVCFGGAANSLSKETVKYRAISEIHEATKTRLARGGLRGKGEVALTAAGLSAAAFGGVARKRRSALDFRGGEERISQAQLLELLAEAVRPVAADFGGEQFVGLYLYVHRAEGLEAGVYRYRAERGELEQVASGDQRVAAAGLSLGQDLAGNACVAFSMLADLERATRRYGDRGYRYVFFEAGAIGQRLYLGAESRGLGATGIGAFYDERVQEYLGVEPAEGRVIYHFAVGYPVADPRVEA